MRKQSAGGDAYLLYVLTPASDVIEAVVIPHIGKIKSVAATLGCLLTGHADGSIGCHQLGKVDPSAQGFMSELRDDMGMGRLWNLVFRYFFLLEISIRQNVHGDFLLIAFILLQK